ncbi:hypothetical protein ACFWY5_29900 [Nonomuraea sp. NPDC059007]|uniref:phage major capsid protein n=1 Tax=Nonomuraea sp. NPDC059007 TaxID=3346692 RepID=UPI0036B6A28E
MPFAVTNGVHVQTGQGFMPAALKTFIPEVWAAKFLVDLEATAILSSPLIVNRDYEGEFQGAGETVRIPHTLDTVTIQEGEFKAYDRIGAPDKADLDSVTMRIDQSRVWHFEVDPLHQKRTQDGINLTANLIKDAASKLAWSIDKHVAATLVSAIKGKDKNNADAAHWGQIKQFAPPTDGDTLYNTLVDMRTQLDIDNVPEAGRFILTGPKEYAYLLKSDKFIDAAQYGAGAVKVTGEVGRILGMPVVISNTVGSHLDTATPAKRGVKPTPAHGKGIHVLVGHQMATTFAGELAEVKPYEPEAAFTHAVKGRYYFGCKVLRPEAIVTAGNVVLT